MQLIITKMDCSREITPITPASVSSDLQYWYPGIYNDGQYLLPSIGEMYKHVNAYEAYPDTYTVEHPFMYEGCKYVHFFAVHYILDVFKTRTYYYYFDTINVTGYIDTIRYVYPQDTIYATKVKVVGGN